MRKFIAILLSVLLLASVPLSQEISDQLPTPIVRVNTRLVMVDVIVTDKDGKLISNLKPTDFTIEESGKKQKIAVFSLQKADRTPAPSAGNDIYSNRPQHTGPTTMLLIDALNTPVQNQMYARHLMLRWAATQLQPGQRIAVYGLTNNLIRLQDFTSDPAELRAAIEKFVPQSLPVTSSSTPPATVSSALATASGGRTDAANMQVSARSLASIRRFAQEETGYNLQMRIGNTLAALKALANSVAGYPGRKNLVWVSASFPFSPLPEDTSPVTLFDRAADPTAPPPRANEIGDAAIGSQISNSFNNDIRRTTTQLSDAQISVYPVDARGLFGSSLTDASSSGLNSAGLLMLSKDYGNAVSGTNQAIVASQNTMKDFARETGGRVFINRNDIDNAIGIAAADGGAYYELGYYPDKKKFDGSFRRLKIAVAQPGLNVRHRSGYFAFDTAKTTPKERESVLNSAIASDAPASLVLFDAQVIPPAPAGKATVPVRFLVPTSSFTAEETGGGKRHINLDFFAVAFGADGRTVANVGQTVDATLEAGQFAQVEQQGLLLPMDVSLAPGEYTLRLAVRDNRTGYVGTVNVPLTLAKPSS